MYRKLRNILCDNVGILLLLMMLFTSCKRNPAPDVSFYYWKSRVAIGQCEQEALAINKVKRLYVRYFDVDINPDAGFATPIAAIKGESLPKCTIIPVIFIKNRVFDGINEPDADSLCLRIVRLATQINARFGIAPTETQFDCDWTVKTRDAYFRFLRMYKATTGQRLSATIRLHQVKYPEKTGIPPVDKGVLMYYNMGRISAEGGNSIYDRAIAQKYNASLCCYSLPLDIALPIFTWGIQIRQNMVVHLLNKMNEGHFEGDNHFKKIGENRYLTVKPCFKGGYYFKRNDEVKIEKVSSNDLREMVKDISRSMKGQPQNLIFYDLDSINIKQHEVKIYQKLANRMR